MTIPVDALTAKPRPEPLVPASQPTLKSHGVVSDPAVVVSDEKKTTPVTPAEVTAAVAEINQNLKIASIGVQFEFDKEANTTLTKVVDVETGKVILQLPSEQAVRLSIELDKWQGLLVSHKV